MFYISGAAPAKNKAMSSFFCLNSWTVSLSRRFTEYLTVASSAAVDLMVLGE